MKIYKGPNRPTPVIDAVDGIVRYANHIEVIVSNVVATEQNHALELGKFFNAFMVGNIQVLIFSNLN
jgi:hypothetical protein